MCLVAAHGKINATMLTGAPALVDARGLTKG